jgi:hypothetical protein
VATANCSASDVPSHAASRAVVQSVPRTRTPCAIASLTLSSRWNRSMGTHAVMGGKLDDERGVLPLEGFRRCFRLLQVLADCLTVIVVVCQRGIHLGEGQLRIIGDDFFRRQALGFIPDDNIVHPNPVSGDAELAAACPRSADDMLQETRRALHSLRIK